MFLLRKVHDAVERLGSQHRNDNVTLFVVGRATLAKPANALVEPCELPQIRQPASYARFQFVQLAGFDAGGKKIDLHQA